jgi:prolyl-tRNA synthetase
MKKEEVNKKPEKKQEVKPEKITFSKSKEEEFSQWYSEIVEKAELVDLRCNIKGFVVFRPWAVRTIEVMYDLFEEELQKRGHEPAWFPALIPESNLKKEAEHVEGFIPQVFWVTQAGNTILEEKMAMRPTSETAIYPMYSIWIRGHSDLPLKIYQRAQVWRYETKATRPLIRSREFYWIEGHDCFATKEEAEAQVLEDIDTTEKVMHQKLGIPFLPLRRPSWDMFPGAIYTIGSDTFTPDGKVIQQPSTHLLSQEFAKTFDIKFKDKDGKDKYVWQTCYGPCVSRILASLVATHGDNKGLVLPFMVSPIQVVIVPIYRTENKEKVTKECKKLSEEIKSLGIRVKIDEKEVSPGNKFYFWEMKGVPLRLEIGEQELKNKEYTLYLRDENKKIKIKNLNDLKKQGELFDKRLKDKADLFINKTIVTCKTKEEVKKALEDKKIARVEFCSIGKDGLVCAETVEKDFNAFVRGVRHDKKEIPKGKCAFCGKKAEEVVYIAKSY